MKITEPVAGAPCWAELGTTDTSGAGAFYGELFGWRVDADPNPEAGGYTMLMLEGDPVAAMSPLYQEGQPVAWTFSVAVTDADATARSASAAGGSVLQEPMDVFDYGRFAVLADPEGAVFTLWQPRAFRGAARMAEPGSLCWVELATRDAGAAKTFYTEVFGWRSTAGDVPGTPPYIQVGLGEEPFGGIYPVQGTPMEGAPPHWTLYFGVDDVDAAVEKAVRLGGTSAYPPMDIPGTGRVAGLADPQGATFAVYAREAG